MYNSMPEKKQKPKKQIHQAGKNKERKRKLLSDINKILNVSNNLISLGGKTDARNFKEGLEKKPMKQLRKFENTLLKHFANNFSEGDIKTNIKRLYHLKKFTMSMEPSYEDPDDVILNEQGLLHGVNVRRAIPKDRIKVEDIFSQSQEKQKRGGGRKKKKNLQTVQLVCNYDIIQAKNNYIPQPEQVDCGIFETSNVRDLLKFYEQVNARLEQMETETDFYSTYVRVFNGFDVVPIQPVNQGNQAMRRNNDDVFFFNNMPWVWELQQKERQLCETNYIEFENSCVIIGLSSILFPDDENGQMKIAYCVIDYLFATVLHKSKEYKENDFDEDLDFGVSVENGDLAEANNRTFMDEDKIKSFHLLQQMYRYAPQEAKYPFLFEEVYRFIELNPFFQQDCFKTLDKRLFHKDKSIMSCFIPSKGESKRDERAREAKQTKIKETVNLVLQDCHLMGKSWKHFLDKCYDYWEKNWTENLDELDERIDDLYAEYEDKIQANEDVKEIQENLYELFMQKRVIHSETVLPIDYEGGLTGEMIMYIAKLYNVSAYGYTENRKCFLKHERDKKKNHLNHTIVFFNICNHFVVAPVEVCDKIGTIVNERTNKSKFEKLKKILTTSVIDDRTPDDITNATYNEEYRVVERTGIYEFFENLSEERKRVKEERENYNYLYFLTPGENESKSDFQDCVYRYIISTKEIYPVRNNATEMTISFYHEQKLQKQMQVILDWDNYSKQRIHWKKIKTFCDCFNITFKNQSIGTLLIHIVKQVFSLRPKTLVSIDKKKALLPKQNFQCNRCDVKIDQNFCYKKDNQLLKAECDHIIPLCQNGTHDVENLQLLCQACHRKKTESDINEKQGYYKRRESVFNDITYSLMNSLSIQHYAIIDTLNEQPYSKIREDGSINYANIKNIENQLKEEGFQYCDIVKCRRHLLMYSPYQFPVFDSVDEPTVFNEKDKERMECFIDKKEKKYENFLCGYFFVKNPHIGYPFRGIGWYALPLIVYGLKQKQINYDDITYKFVCNPNMCLPNDYFTTFAENLVMDLDAYETEHNKSNDEKISKVAINALVGSFFTKHINSQKEWITKDKYIAFNFNLEPHHIIARKHIGDEEFYHIQYNEKLEKITNSAPL